MIHKNNYTVFTEKRKEFEEIIKSDTFEAFKKHFNDIETEGKKYYSGNNRNPIYFIAEDLAYKHERRDITKYIHSITTSSRKISEVSTMTRENFGKIIESGNLEEFKKCFDDLEKEFEGKEYYFDRNVGPLHLAAYRNRTDIAEYLLNNKSSSTNIEAFSKGGWTPICTAVATGNVKMYQFLAEQGARLNKAVFVAAEYGQLDILKNLLERGIDINVEMNGLHLIHFAAIGGSLAVCEFLLEKGMYVDIESSNRHDPETPEAALAAPRGTVTKATPLHCAAARGQAEVCELLIKWKADLNAQNAFNETPLHLIESGGKYDATCDLWLRAGAQIKPGVFAIDRLQRLMKKLVTSRSGENINFKPINEVMGTDKYIDPSTGKINPWSTRKQDHSIVNRDEEAIENYRSKLEKAVTFLYSLTSEMSNGEQNTYRATLNELCDNLIGPIQIPTSPEIGLSLCKFDFKQSRG